MLVSPSFPRDSKDRLSGNTFDFVDNSLVSFHFFKAHSSKSVLHLLLERGASVGVLCSVVRIKALGGVIVAVAFAL